MYVHTIILQEAVDRKDALLGQKDAQLQQNDTLLGQKDAQLQQKDEELALLRSQQTAKSITKVKVRFCSGFIS